MSAVANLSTSIRRPFRPPQFEDEEITRSAIIIHRLLLAAFAILIPLIVVTPFVNREPAVPWAIYGSLFAACLFSMWLTRRGNVKAAGLGVVVAVWIIGVVDVATSGGIRGPGTLLFFVAVLVAGVTLGTPHAVVAAVVSAMAGLAVAAAEATGLLTPLPVSVWRMCAGVVGGLAAVVVFLHLARRFERERQEVGERLEKILNETMEGFALMSRDGQIIEGNPALSKMLGFSLQELRQLRASEIDAVMTQDEISETLRGVVETGSARLETKLRCKSGEILDAELYVSLMTSGPPGVSAAVFLRDVTERKRAEEALRESAEEYRGLFNNSRDAIFVTATDGRFIDANPSMLNLFGYSHEELPGLSAQQLYWDPDDRPRFQDLIARFGSIKDFSATLKTRDGDPIECLLTANARRDKSGVIIGYEGAIRDVTEQKRTQRALRDSEYRLAEAQRLASLGSWEWNMQEGTVAWSDELYRVLGERPGESTPSYETFRQRVHPEDCAAVDELVQRAIETGEPFEVFNRVVWPDGTERIIQSRGEVVHDHTGKPVRMIGSAQDVTDLKRTEQALRESEERYRVLFENAPIGIGVADREGVLQTCNDEMLLLGGYDREDLELAGTTGFYVDPRDRDRMLEFFREQGSVRQAETRIKRKEGGWFDAALSLNSVTIDGNDAVLAIVQDISERKNAERALLQSEARFSKAFGLSPDAITISDLANGRVIEVNGSFVRLSGHSAEEAVGKTSFELGLWGDDRAVRDRWAQMLRSEGRVRDVEMSFFDKQGGVHDCLLAAEVIELDGRPHLLTYATDITEQKRAERQLRESREQLRQLTTRIQSVREQERTAIAREIHDELGQALTGIKMDLSWLTSRLPKKQKAMLERGDALTELLDSTINAVRDLSARLRPSVLDDLGLAAAVEWQVQDVTRRTGISVDLETTTDTVDLDRDRATALFRILQEALTNVVRHADASKISVMLQFEDDEAVLMVKDDGRGISEEQVGGLQSLGILGMRERAFAFGGSVDVEQVDKGGTIVTARVPTVEHAANG